MEYVSIKDVSALWKVSYHKIQKLCEDNRIDEIQRFGRSWMIPKSAEKPADQRKRRAAGRRRLDNKAE